MTEQQRVLLAVGLTFIIFWVWQVILGEIDPPVQIQPEVATQEEVTPPAKRFELDTFQA